MAFTQKTPEQKAADLARAVKLVQSGKFPAFVRYSIMNHTLSLRASGSTDKGSVTYTGTPGNIEFIDPQGVVQKLRVNRISVSILGQDAPDSDVEDVQGATWG